jgi:Tol biopolymer transport system component
MTARAGETMDVTAGSSAVDREVDWTRRASAAFAWVTLFFALWLIGAIVAAARTVVGVGSSSVQPAVDLFNLGVVTLAMVCLAVVARAIRGHRPWRRAFPPGYGVLVGGLAVLLTWDAAERGWLQGVAELDGIEQTLAPPRVLLYIGLALVACGPLRAALRATDAGVPRWAAVLSASFVLVAILFAGTFAPVSSPWLERAPAYAGGELWLMDGDGSHETRLITWTEPGGPTNAAFSPDGSKIAFTAFRVGAHTPVDDDGDIWVADADGTHARPLVTGAHYQWIPHWSPDGVWIVYTDDPPGGPWMASGPPVEGGPGLIGPGFLFGRPAQVRQYAHIWRIRADGTGAPEQITDVEADDRAATYSPDGTKLAFDSTRDGTTRVWVMDVDGGSARRLTSGADDWGATWSPDGTRIAYYSWSGVEEPGSSQLWIIAADGTSPRQLTSGLAPVREPSWSPDGSRIAFIAAEDDIQSIWSIATDGTDPRKLTGGPREGGELISGGGAWGKDGRIVFTHSNDPPAIADVLVREDLAVAAILLTAFLVALVAVVTVRIDPPFGAFAVMMGISTLVFASISEQWRFIPAAVVGGLVVDLLVRFSPARWKAIAAGAGSAATLVLGAALTVALSSGVAWSPTLIAGVAVASVFLGCLIAELVGSARPAGSPA